MKVAFVTDRDPLDVHAWSGSIYHIYDTLCQTGIDITSVGNLANRYRPRNLIKKLAYLSVGAKYHWYRDRLVVRSFGAQLERRLEMIDHDIVFSPGTVPIACLRTEKPIVIWTDATFGQMVDFYPDFTDLARETITQGHDLEKVALSKCLLAIYTSDWAARSAQDDYGVIRKRVAVVPFGGNVASKYSEREIACFVERRIGSICKLLFIGVDWRRKGGELAIEIVRSLNDRGIESELHVVGCHAPVGLPDYVKSHGFVSKRVERERKLLDELYQTATFFVLPTQADCVPVVLAEASAYGLPILSTAVGGVSTVVEDKVNGRTFPLTESATEYCDYIISLLRSPDRYRQTSFAALHRYQRMLNWKAAGKRVRQLLEELRF
jgi:glycosyltransferase involved in cell wall biosynthesis